MIRKLFMLLLIGALIGFAVRSEIRQRAKASLEKEINRLSEEEDAETGIPQQGDKALLARNARKIELELLKEASWGRTEGVKALLDGGADVNARDANGDTPLIAAAFLGFSEAVKLLLERGADINAKNHLGSTALIEAATANKLETVEVLLSAGADASASNIAGLTAVDAGLKENHLEMVQLLKSGPPKKTSQHAYAVFDAGLRQAVIDGDASTVSSLIASGANLNARDKNGWTPLMQAAFRGNNTIVRLLLANKAEPNLADSRLGRTALLLAVMQSHADVVQSLLNSGANPNVQDKLGTTAMSAVQQSGHSHIGRLLRQAGVKTANYNQVVARP